MVPQGLAAFSDSGLENSFLGLGGVDCELTHPDGSCCCKGADGSWRHLEMHTARHSKDQAGV